MRNSITPLPGGRLRKEYRGTLAWKREITLLRQMAGRPGLCPELLDAPLRQAEMTECPGVPLGECVRAASRQEAREMMAALAAWTDAFEREYHRRTGQTAVLEDLSPGNFLWTPPAGRSPGWIRVLAHREPGGEPGRTAVHGRTAEGGGDHRRGADRGAVPAVPRRV